MSEAKARTDASISRLHVPEYNSRDYPPLPPRIRLASNCWERTWWLTLIQPVTQPERLKSFVKRFCTDTVDIRATLRTSRRLCFAVTGAELDQQSEFEIAMLVMAHIERDFGHIERVEDRPASVWPYREFARG